MGNRRKRRTTRHPHGPGAGPGAGPGFGPGFGLGPVAGAGEGANPFVVSEAFGRAMSQQARTSCTECGAPVRWVDAAQAREHGMDPDEAKEFLGVDSVDDLDIWVCTKCDNGGVMGPVEGGWF